MWLLSKRIRVDKYEHTLYRDKITAEEFLKSIGAKKQSRNKYVLKEERIVEGHWKTTCYREYNLEFLKVY